MTNDSPNGADPPGAFRDRRHKELFPGGAFERQEKRLTIQIGQQRKFKFAQFIERDGLDVDARFQLYHVGDRVPVGCLPSDQDVSGIESDVAFSPDGQHVFGGGVGREVQRWSGCYRAVG